MVVRFVLHSELGLSVFWDKARTRIFVREFVKCNKLKIDLKKKINVNKT